MGCYPIRLWGAPHYAWAMKIRSDWRQRLAALVDGKDWAPISRASKLNATYLRDILERNQTPQLKSAEKLSDGLGVPITEWFLEATGESWSAPAAIRTDGMPRDVPLRGSAACGEDGAFEFNGGDPIDYIRRPPRLEAVKDAYALYVRGSSMERWRRDGDIVYVHPHQPVKIGDYVVIQIKPVRSGDPISAYIKQLVKRNENEVRLLQFNPEKELTFKSSRIVTIHRIVDWSELLGL